MAHRILVVDDEPTVLMLVQRLLAREGFDVQTTGHPREALGILAHEEFDLLVVDLHMPEMDGFEVLEWVSSNRPDIVSLVLSGTQRIEDAIAAIQRGAFDFYMKPVERDLLVEKVRRALQHKELRDRNAELLEQLQASNIELENRLSQLELAHRLLQSQARAIQTDLDHARRIQQGLLPKQLPFHDRISLAAFYQPANKVGGDIFDVFKLDERHLGLYIADTAGHGISPALVTVFLKQVFRPLDWDGGEARIVDPGELLRQINERIFNEPFGQDLFVSMTYLVLDVESRRLRYANAGHPPIQLRLADGTVDEIHQTAPALAINPKVMYTSASRALEAGDSLILYTDGVTDAQSVAGEFFGLRRLHEAILDAPPEASAMALRIESELLHFTEGAPWSDDTTVLALRMAPQPDAEIPRRPEIAVKESFSPSDNSAVLSAVEKGCTFACVTGTGTWQESQQLVELCEEAKREKQATVLIDFTHCAHLDSTFLGVLHNLCIQDEACSDFRLQLQNVPRALLKLMSELGLTAVLLHLRSKPRTLPDSMVTREGKALGQEEMGHLLLRAHEALVEADPKNADRFAAVLEVLQQSAT